MVEESDLFHYKVHRISGHPPMLAVADYGLLRRKFVSNELTIEVNKELYEGEIANKDQVASLMALYDIIILVGEHSVDLAKELGLVTEDSVLRIGDIPHVQIYKFKY
ncbi:MAG: DUF424 family protein [Desulfurococcales archaeon]|nr:DUF424 family protein [Desulfurococcales archaeon]